MFYQEAFDFHTQYPSQQKRQYGSGRIQLIMGPMFSGKTTELLRRIRRYTIAKRSCIVVKYEADKRYSSDCAATHDNHVHKATSARRLGDISGLEEYDVVGIDEGQFYPDLVETCESLANKGVIVIVAALDGTFQRKPFPGIAELFPLVERIDKLHAVCMVCQRMAAFTSRLGQETQVELIGGTDRYISTCRRCFLLQDKLAQEAHQSPAKAAQTTSSKTDDTAGVPTVTTHPTASSSAPHSSPSTADSSSSDVSPRSSNTPVSGVAPSPTTARSSSYGSDIDLSPTPMPSQMSSSPAKKSMAVHAPAALSFKAVDKGTTGGGAVAQQPDTLLPTQASKQEQLAAQAGSLSAL